MSDLADGDLLKSVGYFDAPGQKAPVKDSETCCLCHAPLLDEKRLCRSLMLLGGKKSYFFSYHERCRDMPKLQEIEYQLIDEFSKWEDRLQ